MIVDLYKRTDGYWRVAQVHLDLGIINAVNYDNELFEKREDAERYLEERQLKWEKEAWDFEEYCSKEYQLRFATHKMLQKERRGKIEEWHAYLRKTYWDPIIPEVFSSCCQKIIAEIKRKVNNLSDSDIQKIRDEGTRFFTPWQKYGGSAKIWSFMDLEQDSEELSYYGMFVKDSLLMLMTKPVPSVISSSREAVPATSTESAALSGA